MFPPKSYPLNEWTASIFYLVNTRYNQSEIFSTQMGEKWYFILVLFAFLKCIINLLQYGTMEPIVLLGYPG